MNRLSRLGERFENADDDEARRRRQSRRQSRRQKSSTFFALLLDAGAVGAGRGDSAFARSLRIKSRKSIVSIVSLKSLFNWVKRPNNGQKNVLCAFEHRFDGAQTRLDGPCRGGGGGPRVPPLFFDVACARKGTPPSKRGGDDFDGCPFV